MQCRMRSVQRLGAALRRRWCRLWRLRLRLTRRRHHVLHAIGGLADNARQIRQIGQIERDVGGQPLVDGRLSGGFLGATRLLEAKLLLQEDGVLEELVNVVECGLGGVYRFDGTAGEFETGAFLEVIPSEIYALASFYPTA